MDSFPDTHNDPKELDSRDDTTPLSCTRFKCRFSIALFLFVQDYSAVYSRTFLYGFVLMCFTYLHHRLSRISKLLNNQLGSLNISLKEIIVLVQ